MTLEVAAPRLQCTSCRAPASPPRWSLIVAILGSTMAFVDSTVVNVALPVMQRQLDGSLGQMQWIVEAYALLLSSLVLVGGALGDRLGRRRAFVAGVTLFAIASAACAAAPNATALIIARGVQGVGAALLVPGSLALISAAYPEDERGPAIGTWSAASSITSAIGPVVGGWVVEHGSWRWLFLINVPIGVLVVFLAVGRVGETRDETAPQKLDLAGAFFAAAGLGAIVFALLDAPTAGGIGSARVLVLLAAGIATLIAFVIVEARRRYPMVPLGLFRSRTFSGANLLTLLLYAATGGSMFFVPFNMIQVQRYSPAAAGAALVPIVLLISAMSPWTGRLVTRFGPRLLLVIGPLFAAAGLALFALPERPGPYVTTFLPGILSLGVGMGFTVAPLTTAVMQSVDRSHAGVASGVNNAVARTAGLLAIAVLGVVLTTRFDRARDEALTAMHLAPAVRAAVDAQRGQLAAADLSMTPPELQPSVQAALDNAYMTGFRTTMILCAVLAALGAVCAGLLVEGRAKNDRPSRGRIADTPRS